MELDVETVECRRPTCHNPVAIGKNGEPLKDCETHRDKRPSSKARAAMKNGDTTTATLTIDVPAEGPSRIVEQTFGAPRPAPKPTSAKPTKKARQDAALKARLAAPAKSIAEQIVEEGSNAPLDRALARRATGGVVGTPLPADQPEKVSPLRAVASSDVAIKTRPHKGSGRILAEAIKDGKHIYAYGATDEEARTKMRERLA